ncbi:MAG: hypothetical protein KJ799_01870 [Bacteroidetes bacterium]|nr:hypothetical protein [Bacteroidota bacterium]
MKTTSIFTAITFLLLIGTNIIGQEISKLLLNKIEPFKTMQGSTADIVQVLPGERIIEKTSLDGKTFLFCLDKNGRRTKIYEGNPVDYFSHSQNGNRICFSTGGDEFIVKDVNTLQEFRFVKLDPVYLSRFANISPDGEEITFFKSKRLRNEGETLNDDIIVVRNSSTKEDRVIGNGGCPKWSPNSSQIVFSRVEGGKCDWTDYLWIVNSDCTGLRQLNSTIHMGGAHVKWSSDGKYVMDSDREGNLRIVDVLKDEAVVIPMSRFGKAPDNARKEPSNSSWSPDGKSILAEIMTYNFRDEMLDKELFLISVDGTKIEKLIIPTLNNDEFRLNPKLFPIWLNNSELLFRNTQQGNLWNKAVVRSAE